MARFDSLLDSLGGTPLVGLPNLSPLPPADRAAVGRALSKKPEDRFPTCIDFIRALYQADNDLIGGAIPGTYVVAHPGRMETPGTDVFVDGPDALRKLAADSRPTAICAFGQESRIEVASDSRLFGFDFLTLGSLLHRNKTGHNLVGQ